MQTILGFLLHLGPAKGWKTAIGGLIKLALSAGLIPPQFVIPAQWISDWLLMQGIASKVADATGILPAEPRKVAFPVS